MIKNREKILSSSENSLGLLNFYSKFLPNLQSRLHPLHELLQKGVVFKWTDECEKVFEHCKKAIVGSPILSYFDTCIIFGLKTD